MNFINRIQGSFIGKVPFYMLVAIVFIRLISIWIMGPMPQDAYYFFYSQHPSLSYFDHPPAIAYLLWLFTAVLGKNVFAIKLADSVLTALTCIAVYKLAIRLFPKFEAEKIIVLFLSTLMVSILSLVSTPDTPLLFFWSLSLIALYEAIFNQKKKYWLLAGVLMGLAFDSKYTAVFLPAGMILFLLLSDSNRKYLLTFWPWATCIIMVAVSSPVVIWNIENHFASFAFQGSQRMHEAAAFTLKPKFILGLLGHQLALLIPVLFISIIVSVVKLIRSYSSKWSEMSTNGVFLLCFFLPIFLTFLLLSPIYWIKINWMMPAYITGTILAGSLINRKWINLQVIISFIVHLGLLVEVLFYPVQIRSDDTWVGWKSLSEKTNAIKSEYKADFVFSADSYKTAGELNLYNDSFIYGQNIIGQNALQFDFIGTDLSLLNGKSAIFIDSDPRFKNSEKDTVPNNLLKSYFSSVTQLKPIFIYNGARPVRKFYVYLCKGYIYQAKKATTELLQD
ncbi:ArnT family glycosyltransferase [Pedobacter suwonensis]|uniref:ArnT family glycosyltransferase n=3 Tax=Pedobacter suwonensis TaxID=332999 RepID=UPI0036A7398D